MLSGAEASEARRLRFAHHRHLFAARRLAARTIVAGRLEVDAARVRFDRPVGHEPAVLVDGNEVGLALSISSSGPIAVVALAREGGLGVDIERRRVVPERVAIAGELFGVAGARLVRDAPEPESSANLLRLWTRKEAIGKALGRGLASVGGPALEDAIVCRRIDRADLFGCLAADEPIETVRQLPFRWVGKP